MAAFPVQAVDPGFDFLLNFLLDFDRFLVWIESLQDEQGLTELSHTYLFIRIM